jgi:hypothetical protein
VAGRHRGVRGQAPRGGLTPEGVKQGLAGVRPSDKARAPSGVVTGPVNGRTRGREMAGLGVRNGDPSCTKAAGPGWRAGSRSPRPRSPLPAARERGPATGRLPAVAFASGLPPAAEVVEFCRPAAGVILAWDKPLTPRRDLFPREHRHAPRPASPPARRGRVVLAGKGLFPDGSSARGARRRTDPPSRGVRIRRTRPRATICRFWPFPRPRPGLRLAAFAWHCCCLAVSWPSTGPYTQRGPWAWKVGGASL